MKKLIIALLLLTSYVASAQIELPHKLSDRAETIIKHYGFTVSYNEETGTPNWSAWMLTKSHIDSNSQQIKRGSMFYTDSCAPSSSRVQSSDYSRSGYDRGHMCPAADMGWSTQSMHDCFYMTNICPQVPELNRESWKNLESSCRKWVAVEDTLYIVCGPVYIDSSTHKIIGVKTNVMVPDGFFKVVLSLRKGHEKSIGFYYRNISSEQTVSETAHTVDYIERLTGIDFFYVLDDRLENRLEERFSISSWQ